jgi:hypothetical protein
MMLMLIIIAWGGLGGLICLALAKAAGRSCPDAETPARVFTTAAGTETASSPPARPSVRWSLQPSATLVALAVSALRLGASPSLTLEWDPSTDTTVIGYKIHCQDLSSTNVVVVDVGNTNQFTFTNLAATFTYRIYVTAYDAVGLESDASNLIEFTVPLGPLSSASTRDEQGALVMSWSLEAVPGKRVALQSSSNLVDWVTLSLSDPDQPLSLQFTNSPARSQQFFRSVCLP